MSALLVALLPPKEKAGVDDAVVVDGVDADVEPNEKPGLGGAVAVKFVALLAEAWPEAEGVGAGLFPNENLGGSADVVEPAVPAASPEAGVPKEKDGLEPSGAVVAVGSADLEPKENDAALVDAAEAESAAFAGAPKEKVCALVMLGDVAGGIASCSGCLVVVETAGGAALLCVEAWSVLPVGSPNEKVEAATASFAFALVCSVGAAVVAVFF